MKKSSTSFVCQECGYESLKFMGKCPECGNWNSFKEISRIIGKDAGTKSLSREVGNITPRRISEIKDTRTLRIATGFTEMDGVFGGGIVPGSVTLLAGDPGIGKSTLLLQLALQIAGAWGPVPTFPPASARSNLTSSSELRAVGSPSRRATPSQMQKNADTYSSSPVLYISAEESEEQVKLRVMRIVNNAPENFLLLSITNTDAVVGVIEKIKPSIVIIDSMQAMESENAGGLSGAIGQVRYAASEFVRVAKTHAIPLILVGHVTKEGMVAGPMTLSHMVDVVLFLEGEKFTSMRMLRSLKNRFGPVDEVGIFTMEGSGMQEITNPEQLFLTEQKKDTPGSVLVATLEGTRSFLVEVQSLAVFSKLPMPRRVAAGIDAKRLELLLAVLQKHCRIPTETADVFVNVAGGLKLSDPAADLAICLAVFSSLKNITLSMTVAIAEVGLLGELRMVGNLEKRMAAAKKLGFEHIITAKTHRTIFDVLRQFSK